MKKIICMVFITCFLSTGNCIAQENDSFAAIRDKIVLPSNRRTGQTGKWPEQKSPIRKGGVN